MGPGRHGATSGAGAVNSSCTDPQVVGPEVSIGCKGGCIHQMLENSVRGTLFLGHFLGSVRGSFSEPP
eukprot:539746-Pelagomonas_calceolata.AAC.1